MKVGKSMTLQLQGYKQCPVMIENKNLKKEIQTLKKKLEIANAKIIELMTFGKD